MTEDVVDLILRDHRELERMFAQLKSDPDSRPSVVPLLTTLLTAHSRAEEAEVYPAVRKEAGHPDDVEHSQEEHLLADRLLLELGIGALELLLLALQLLGLRLQLLGERLGLLEQFLRAAVGDDRVQDDAERLAELLEERLVDVGEGVQRGQLDDRQHLLLEEDRHDDDVHRLRLADAEPADGIRLEPDVDRRLDAFTPQVGVDEKGVAHLIYFKPRQKLSNNGVMKRI